MLDNTSQVYRVYYLLSGGFFPWSKFQVIYISNICFPPALFKQIQVF